MKAKKWIIALMCVAGVGFLSTITPLKAQEPPPNRIEGHVYSNHSMALGGYVVMYYAPVSGPLVRKERVVEDGYYFIPNPSAGKWTGGHYWSSGSETGSFDNASPFNYSGSGVLVHDLHLGSEANHGKICGFVTEDGDPVPGRFVYLKGPVERMTPTDGDGFYQFHNLPPGNYTIMVGMLAQPCKITFYETHKKDFGL